MVKSYNQKCPVACTLDIIGDRWSLLLLRDLVVYKTRRFNDFLDASRGMSPNTLSSRLKQFEADGIIESELYQAHPPRLEYSLTPKGREIGPVLRALRAWGRKYG